LNIDQLKKLKPGTLLKLKPTRRLCFPAVTWVLTEDLECMWLESESFVMFLDILSEENSDRLIGYAKILYGEKIYYIIPESLKK